jgi:hypothetical protein
MITADFTNYYFDTFNIKHIKEEHILRVFENTVLRTTF